MRKLPIVTSGLVVLVALTGCGGTGTSGGTETTQPAATAQMTSQTSPTIESSPTATSDDGANPTEEASPGSTPTEDQESSAPSGDATGDSFATGGSTNSADPEPTSGGALPPDVKGQTLVLADFFNPDSDWTEGRYDVADRGSVSGIAREVSTCGLGGSVPTLELRLANNFDDLKFEVGQNNDSRSSDQTLTVRVEGNNKQLYVQTIPFNEVQDFSVPVADVNALKIQFYLDEQNENCYQGSVQAVIYDVELQ